MHTRPTMDHIKEAVTPAFAGWTVNGTTLTVGTVFEQWGVQIIALLGLCITGYFQWRQSQRDKKRLIMDEEDHLLHLKEHEDKE